MRMRHVMTADVSPGLSVDDIAPIGVQDLSRHVRGVVAGEELIAGRDLCGLAGALHGDLAELFRERVPLEAQRFT
jgi:hypothetical protein